MYLYVTVMHANIKIFVLFLYIFIFPEKILNFLRMFII